MIVKVSRFDSSFFRNAMLCKAGLKFPTPVKTGTTIAGIVFKVCTCNIAVGREVSWIFTLGFVLKN